MTNEIPKDLFHYTKMETALEKILPNKSLKISPIGFTNDPRETKSWSIPKLQPSNDHQKSQFELIRYVLDEVVPKVMKEEWKVLCFASEGYVPVHVDDALEKFQYKSFNHGYAHPRMWAQYASNHRGVCLWFDGEKISENIKRELGNESKIYHGIMQYDVPHGALVISPLSRTIYDDVTELGVEDAARKYVFENYEYFFLRKHPDWQTEAEYRWLVHSKKREGEFVSISGALKGVLVGGDFPDVYIPSLLELCKGLSIPIGKINWQNGMPVADLNSIYQP